jgi:hypothetical protein
MPPIRAEAARLAPLDLLTDRWLIEALSQMSSNPQVRAAAAAWLAAYRAALERGCAEAAAQAGADEALQRLVTLGELQAPCGARWLPGAGRA